MLIIENKQIGIKTWHCMNERKLLGPICFFSWITWTAEYFYNYPKEIITSGWNGSKQQASGDNVIVWATFCWVKMYPIIYVKSSLLHTASLNVTENRVHFIIVTPISYDDSGIFQLGNTPYHSIWILQEWFQEHEDFTILPWLSNSPDLDPIEHIGCVGPASSLWRTSTKKDLLLISWCQISEDIW